MTASTYHSNSGFISIIIIILTTNVYHLLLYHQNYHLNTPHCLNLQSSLAFTNITVSLSVKYLCFDNDIVIETQTMSAGMPMRNTKKVWISQELLTVDTYTQKVNVYISVQYKQVT